jgi:hypothetical protein
VDIYILQQLINSIFSDDNIRHLWILTLTFVWCNIPVDDDKTPTSSKFPKNLFSYIKSQKSESSNIATLRQNGQLHSDTESLHLPLSLYFLYFFLYFDIFVFISLVIHGRFFRCLSIFWGMFSVTDRCISKNIFSYIKSQKSESSNIATLRQNGQLHSDTKAKANILNEPICCSLTWLFAYYCH